MGWMKKEYRIVRDCFLGYEVQVRRWWFPIWVQAGFANTHSSIEKARAFARALENECVEYLGRF